MDLFHRRIEERRDRRVVRSPKDLALDARDADRAVPAPHDEARRQGAVSRGYFSVFGVQPLTEFEFGGGRVMRLGKCSAVALPPELDVLKNVLKAAAATRPEFALHGLALSTFSAPPPTPMYLMTYLFGAPCSVQSYTAQLTILSETAAFRCRIFQVAYVASASVSFAAYGRASISTSSCPVFTAIDGFDFRRILARSPQHLHSSKKQSRRARPTESHEAGMMVVIPSGRGHFGCITYPTST